MGFFDSFFSSNSNKSESSVQLSPKEEDDLKRIELVLEELTQNQAYYIAAVALLLGQVAYADSEISQKEKDSLYHILKSNLGLTEKQAQEVARLAIESTLRNTLEDYEVWERVKQYGSPEQKKKLLEALFQLATEDGISNVENEEIRVISKAIGFTHNEFIQIRLGYREHLSVLKSKKPL